MKYLKYVLASGMAAMGFLLLHYLLTRQPIRFGANAVPESASVATVLIGYALTVMGVLLGTGYRSLQAMKVAGKDFPGLPNFSRQMGRSVDLWMGLFASPIVFALILQSTGGAGWAAITAIALQNGFSCTVVISGIAPQRQAHDLDRARPTLAPDRSSTSGG